MRPIYSSRLKKCSIERQKSLISGSIYQMFNSETGELLMVAKQVSTIKCHYHISMYNNIFDKA